MNPMPLSHMLYLSQTTRPWAQEDLAALGAQCQSRNQKDGLTGLLLYGNGHFLQLLEGRRQPLVLAYDRISRDERHEKLTVLLDGPITQRTFPEWAMGVLNVDTAADVDRQRFRAIVAAFEKSPGPMPENAAALALLREFRSHASARPPARLPEPPG